MDSAQIPFVFDTLFILISGALVMWMAAGFTMLEAGLVRAKNTAEILLKNLGLYAIACLFYWAFGYAAMYVNGSNDWFTWPGFGLPAPSADQSVPVEAGFFFQMVFVATAMSIVSGAVAERMRLWVFFVFAAIMSAVIYPVEGYWTWGEGFLNDLGFHDFAGSGIVHLAGACAALTAVMFVGPRMGRYRKDGRVRAMPGANLPLAAIGTWILWFGWLGFNGGSQLAISSADDVTAVAKAFTNTNLSACAGALAALLTARLRFGSADLTMALNGALAGLVAITAEPVAPSIGLTIAIGAVAGILVVFAIIALDRMRLDDPVGAISVHGVVGIWGLMAVPFSASDASFGIQALGALVIIAWVGGASALVWWLLKMTVGLRVDEEAEMTGLDVSECGLEAYPEFTSQGQRSN